MLSTVKCAPLLGIVSEPPKQDDPPVTGVAGRLLTNFNYYVVGPVDTYGFSLFLAGKINVVLTVVVGSALVRAGVDSASVLSALGVSDTVQAGGAAMGAAMLTNALLLPLHLYFLPTYSPVFARLSQSFSDRLVRK